MLIVTLPGAEAYDEERDLFFELSATEIRLEHSLVSLSKWEAKWQKPFLVKDPPKTVAETIDYIRCMTITQNVDPFAYQLITDDIMNEVNEYIEHPMTATVFMKSDRVLNREIITSEIIYFWMVALNIPFECQKWHLNRLLTLINVCNLKSQPKEKIRRQEILARNRALNEARKKKLGTTG